VDSITAVSRLSLRSAEQQPEAFSERTGKKDPRGAYGHHGREMIAWLKQLQHARGKSVVFVAILEMIKDEFNRPEWQIQLEGGKTGRELPGIVDQVVSYQFIDFGDGVPSRASPNQWGFPAKDRSGRLDQIEKPHLGRTHHQAHHSTPNPKRRSNESMSIDLNNADEQRTHELIPAGTIATLHAKVRPGGAGEGGHLTRSKDGNSGMLDLECTFIGGPHDRRKLFQRLLVSGTTEGQRKMTATNAGRIRALLESAYGVKPSDSSETARQARRLNTYGDLDGLRFVARIGIEPTRGDFKAKNIIAEVITPDRREWYPVEQLRRDATAPAAAATPSGAPSAAPTITKPAWAR
jgi:AAA domain